MEGLLTLIIQLVIVGLIFWAIWWFLGYVAPPEPFNKVLRVLVGLFALIFVLYILLGMLGSVPTLRLPK